MRASDCPNERLGFLESQMWGQAPVPGGRESVFIIHVDILFLLNYLFLNDKI